MIARWLRTGSLIAILLVNTLSGTAKVAGFWSRHAGEEALPAADLDGAFASLNASLRWQRDDAPTYILIGRAIQLAESNGLTVKGLEGYTHGQMLGVGVRSVAWAIALNPADAWAWLNLADLYRASRTARTRLERLRAAGDAAAPGDGTSPEAKSPPAPKPEPEDRLLVAAALKAQELEPESYLHHDLLTNFYRARGMFPEAGDEIRESFALMPALQSHALIQDERVIRDLSDPILEGIEKASANPFFPPVTVVRARAELLEKAGRLTEAVEAYKDLARIGGAEYEAECSLAVAKLYQLQRSYSESIPYLDRALEADPNGTEGTAALYHRGVAHANLSDHKRAVDDLRRYLGRKPGSPEVILFFADELALAGDAAEAEKVYLGVVRSHPDESAGYRRLIALMRRQRRWKEALEYAETLRKIDPEDRSAEAIVRQSRDSRDAPSP